MRLGGDVHDRVGAFSRSGDRDRIGDVPLVEDVLDAREVPGIPRVGQLVEDDHAVPGRDEAPNETDYR